MMKMTHGLGQAGALAATSLAMALLLSGCNQDNSQASKQAAAQSDAAQTETAQSAQASADKADLSAESSEYKAWVITQMDGLLADSETFVAHLKAGELDKAKALYPLARMYFERSEPVAALFGDLDPRIDNREADLEAGEAWTGFHAIEKILWTQNTTEGTQALGDQLLADIKELRTKVDGVTMNADEMIAGAVDLLNEVSTSKITGEEEIFSHTDLYDFKANIEGAEKIFVILTPKLAQKDAALVSEIQARFGDVHTLLDKHKVGDKDYKPYTELSADETKALGEAVNKLGEPLAKMAVVLE